MAADQVPDGAERAPLAGDTEAAAKDEAASPEAIAEETAVTGGDADAVTIVAVDIAFDPDALSITAGSEVPVILESVGAAAHNFSIDELNHNDDLAPGAIDEITISAVAGTYVYYCNAPGHKVAGMVGTLTVE